MLDFEQKMLPIGIESFEEMRTDRFYYVDKTALIGELLRRRSKVNLFTRPRRFGKSLNMAMLKSFFEIGCDSTLFDGLDIAKETALCEQYMGKFPVISISLKGVSASNFKMACSMLRTTIGDMAMRFYELLSESTKLTVVEKEMYKQLVTVDKAGEDVYAMSNATMVGSLKTLSKLLEKHYDSKVIILIDEYDVPLAKAKRQGYYDEMIELIRNLFGDSLKTNDSLYMAVLTGCLRVSKESIFTGLNNLRVLSITSFSYAESFGFTDEEVRSMLAYYDLADKYDVVREWYDGYCFGDANVYCPWDVINYINDLLDWRTLPPQNYWINTSSNEAVKTLLEKATSDTRGEIERLIAGESISKEISEELTYKELYDSVENVWSVLFTTGYLTQRGESDGKMRKLVIPNREIHDIFLTQIQKWAQGKVRENSKRLNMLCEAFRNADAETAQKIFGEYLDETISIRDTAIRNELKENYYHGFLLGLLRFREDWRTFSNRESGDGYADIVVEIFAERLAIVIEMKYAQNGDLDAGCEEALRQIERERYEEQPRQDGMRRVIKCGVACHVKDCKVIFHPIDENRITKDGNQDE